MQLTGDLSKVSLPNLLQLVRNGELTGKVSLLQGAKSATIYLVQGQIIHVESDIGEGREAMMELFLWLAGSFSFQEVDNADVKATFLPAQHQEDTLERIVRDGIMYLEQRKYLDQLRISGRTILVPTEISLQPQTWLAPVRAALFPIIEPILVRLDGRKTLAQALVDANLNRRSFTAGVYNLIAGGFVLVREPDSETDQDGERVNLPSWVVSRLKQDNSDLSQSIVDMVIWVDRVKCWMYQVDADFVRILDEVAAEEAVEAPDEDFFTELARGNIDMEEPLFGERGIPDDMIQTPTQKLPPATPPAPQITPVARMREGPAD